MADRENRSFVARAAALALVAVAAVTAFAQAPLPGVIRVTADPAATLWVDHRPQKTAEAFTVEVQPGTPTVLRVSAPGYVTQYRTVTLGPGERRHEPFELEHEPIPVLFRSETPATVLCDGAELGETPFHTFFTEPRAYRVVVRAPGFQDQAIRLDLTNGKPRVVDATLVADSATLEVASEPAGARVLVNGVEHGRTPCTLDRIRAGAHTLSIRLDGYKPITHDITVAAGDKVPLDFALERLPAGLTVTTIPEGARVYVDGEFRGTSDLTLAGLPEGAHTIRVSLPGHEDLSRMVTLKGGATQVEEFALKEIYGTLSVQTQPGRVEVWVGGKRLLTTRPAQREGFTSAIEQIRLPPGPTTLTLKAAGYADATRTVTIAPNETVSLRVRLTFQPNLEVKTALGTYRGVFTRQNGDGSLTLELKPGTYRTFLPGEIRSKRFLTPTP